ncbi:MAG: hypothetical protein KGH60_00040 [Candidatus Micrarchaeota archaeon]|nr:hypothetical protein [Candidatus Micrarchaeota archaeon]
MLDGIKNKGLNDLIMRLHSAIRTFVKDIDEVVAHNQNAKLDEINELRDHINERLKAQEDIPDRDKILELLDLLVEDKAVLELVREDAEEWVRLLDAIEISVADEELELTAEQQEQVKKIGELSAKIKELVRKAE